MCLLDKEICSRCFDFNNFSNKEGEGKLGYLVFPKVVECDHCNSTCRTGKIGNTLPILALTIIGHHFLKQWELEKEEFNGTKKKTQNKEKMIVDVNAILIVEKKKKKKSKPTITTSKEII